MLYGQRPRTDAVWHLSPYEFVTYWEPQLLSYPQNLAEASDPRHHATLTASGVEKLKAAAKSREVLDLEPGIDYVVKENDDETEQGNQTWLAFPPGAALRDSEIRLRHF